MHPLSLTSVSTLRETLNVQCPAQLSMTHFDVEQYSDTDYDRYGITLPPFIERAVKKRRAEYLAARICARSALQEFGINALPRNKKGERRPLWPETCIGSITHSHGIAACCVANSAHVRSIGLDIETWIEEDKVERLAPAILTKNEMLYWATLSTPLKSTWLTRVFSAKETLFKLINPLVGQSFYFHDAEVTQFTPQRNELSLKLLTRLNDEFIVGYQADIHYCDMPQWVITQSFITTSL